MKLIYLVDPDPVALHFWSATLQALKYEVIAFESAEAFLPWIVNAQPGCILLESHLPGKDGLAVLRELARCKIEMPVVMVTAHGSVTLAVQAMRAG